MSALNFSLSLLYHKSVNMSTQKVFRSSIACVWGKHSAWTSTARNRADARTHHQQRNGAHISLPPYIKHSLMWGGGTRSVTEGARVTLSFRNFHCIALSLSRFATAPSRREPFVKPLPTEKHHQRNLLGGASYFSAKDASPRVYFFML